jgi:hypothetical protein
LGKKTKRSNQKRKKGTAHNFSKSLIRIEKINYFVRNTMMMIGAPTIASLFTTLVAITTLPAPTHAVDCINQSLGAVTVENLFVPDKRRCTLTNTIVQGNINVGTLANLTATSVRVKGSVQAEGANTVIVRTNSQVNGDVQLKAGRAATVVSTTIGGTLLFDGNTRAVRANLNTVGGDLQAFRNTGGVTITRNNMNGNLQCKENTPAPTGFGNQAASKEDQCASF